MASRRSMLVLAAVLVVGCFVGMGIQSITGQEAAAPSEEIQSTFPAPTAEEPAVGIRSIGNPEDLRKAEAFLRAITGDNPRRAGDTAVRTAWEYKSDSFSVFRANALGKQGWELVNVYPSFGPEGSEEERAVYKRPL